jgi:methionyl-tRNA synthetase
MTLKQLYERSENQSKNSYQNNKHFSIIENGIKAVNIYHKFSNGRIQPGACDETQRFITISIDTSISYLITTDNHDEGDIIMRILRY